jgi:hypothetical protein
MASNGERPNGAGGSRSSAAAAARRLLVHDPGLVREMAHSLLEGRKGLPRSERRQVPRRRLLGASGMREAARHGIEVAPDLAYRALQHAIDPKWTRGHSFSVAYELTGEGGGRWVIAVEDGSVRVDPESDGQPDVAPDATVRMSAETWHRVLAGEITPP